MGYHVGHSISVSVARDQGYFVEEGLGEIEFDGRGLLPRRYEREALALTMEERGVDLALGAGPATAFWQRAHGADLYIVGGWRLDGPAGTRGTLATSPSSPAFADCGRGSASRVP